MSPPVIEADLHLHSYHSDGLFSPADVVRRASEAGLKAIALTDHDTVAGLAEARAAAPAGFGIISAIELSSVFRGREIHLLAYQIDPEDQRLAELLEPLRQERALRAERIVARLNKLGIGVTMDEVHAIARAARVGPAPSLGRPHVAEAIVRHGAARDMDDAFIKFLRRGQPAYVGKACVTVERAADVIRANGGVLMVAHPALNLSDADTEALAAAWLDGVEVWHPKHDRDQVERLERLTRRLGLIASGGSDYHGPGRSHHEIAAAGVSLQTVSRIREIAQLRARG